MLATAGGMTIFYFKRANQRLDGIHKEVLDFTRLLALVKHDILELTDENIGYAKTEEQREAEYRFKLKNRRALERCVDGAIADKLAVKAMIKSIIKRYIPTDEEIGQVFNFDPVGMTNDVRRETMCHIAKEYHGGKQGMRYLVNEYNFSVLRYKKDGTNLRYVDETDLYEIVKQETRKHPLTTDDKLSIITNLLYVKYKGYGVVDSIQEFDIDGLNIGTSGSRRPNPSPERVFDVTESVWLHFDGNFIHFRFCKFETEDEMRRVVTLMSRFGNPKPLDIGNPYRVNNTAEGSRIACARPPMAANWTAVLRKFPLRERTTTTLLTTKHIYHPETGEVIREPHQNIELPDLFTQYLMKGEISCLVSGRQGSGKTTYMSCMLCHISGVVNIGLSEMAMEMGLQDLLSDRNIITLQETPGAKMSESLDLLKKMDRTVSVVGEIATDEICLNAIQVGQTASNFTIASQHGNTTENAIESMTNAYSRASGVLNLEVIERQIIDVFKLDIHWDKDDVSGARFMERVTEVVPIPRTKEFPEYDPNNPEESMNRIELEYYQQRTNALSYFCRDIIRFNKETLTYDALNLPSQHIIARIESVLPIAEKEAFVNFMYDQFGHLLEGGAKV